MNSSEHDAQGMPAGLLRRLGALISDTLVVVGLLLLGSLPFIGVLQHLHAKAMVPSEVGWTWSAVYWVWLVTIWLSFMGYFWVRSGQTVGMQAWRVRVERAHGELLSWTQAIQRLFFASLPWLPGLIVLALADQYHMPQWKRAGQGLLALGVINLLSMYVHTSRLTWHDRMSKSHIKRLHKP